MVTTAVSEKTIASEACALTTVNTRRRSTIFAAVTTRTAPRTASGILVTAGAASRMTATITSEWVIADTLVRAPERTLTAVRAMAPVAGMPPNSPVATFARPWPTISRRSDVRVSPVMASATLAESRLSIAARMATASAGPTRWRTTVGLRSGRRGAGRWCGSAPIVGTPAWQATASTVTLATATIDEGTRRVTRGQSTMMAAVAAPSPTVAAEADHDIERDRHEGRVDHAGPGPFRLAEQERDLLERDRDGDPDGEALEHRPGDELDQPAEPGEAHRDDEDAGDDRHRGNGPHAVVGHDRHEHDGHRPGRAGHLDRRAAEDRGDDARDDRRDDPGGRPDAGRHAEAERERQGDDADGDAGEQVAPPRRAEAPVVRRTGHQPCDGAARVGRGALHEPAGPSSSSSVWRARPSVAASTVRAASRKRATEGSVTR